MKTLSSLSPFVRGYITAALFTSDPNPPGGCDYAECGRADDMFPRVPADFVAQAEKDCDAFQAANREDLDAACVAGMQKNKGYSLDSAGADFWFTRNHHGVGFWDRELGDIGEALTDACKAFGEHDLEFDS